jgi:hypothetical protein
MKPDFIQHSCEVDKASRFDTIADRRLHLRKSIRIGYKVSTVHFV